VRNFQLLDRARFFFGWALKELPGDHLTHT
jgi:hypothetical protein